jgi:hypothetical protein
MVLTSISEWARMQFERLNYVDNLGCKKEPYSSFYEAEGYDAQDCLAKFLIEEVNIPKSSAYKIQNSVYFRYDSKSWEPEMESRLNKYMIRVLEKGLIEGNAKGRSRDTHVKIASIRDKEKLRNYIENEGMSKCYGPCPSCGDQPDEMYLIPTSCHINKSPSPLGCTLYEEGADPDPEIYCCANCLSVFIDYLVLDFSMLLNNLVELYGSQKKVAEALSCRQSVVSKITNKNLEQIYLPSSLVLNLYMNTLKLHRYYKKELITEEQLLDFSKQIIDRYGIKKYYIPYKLEGNLDYSFESIQGFRISMASYVEEAKFQEQNIQSTDGLCGDLSSIRIAQKRGLPVLLLTSNALIACYFSVDWKSTLNNIFEFIAGAHKNQASILLIVEPRYLNNTKTKQLELQGNRLRALDLSSWPWEFDGLDGIMGRGFDEFDEFGEYTLKRPFFEELKNISPNMDEYSSLKRPFFEELKNISPNMDKETIWSNLNEGNIRVEEELKESLLSFIVSR